MQKRLGSGSIPDRCILNSNAVVDVVGHNTVWDEHCTDKTTNMTLIFEKIDSYYEWIDLQKYSKSNYSKLKSYYKKHLANKRFESPMELQKYIETKSAGISSIIKTIRNYFNYCEQHDKLSEDILFRYRKVLKVKKSSSDYYVPNDQEVIDNYHIVKNYEDLRLVYLVLATSGIRLVETLDFLASYDETKFKKCDGFVVYNISSQRNTKSCNNIYLPNFVFDQLKHINLGYDQVRRRMIKRKLTLSMKYMRKWHYNLMLYNNFPESVADFIQGRASNSVSANHYLSKSRMAEHWYSKLIEKLNYFK